MKDIIQEVTENISQKFEEELKRLLSEKRDISEFILAIKKTLDETGTKLVAEALETLDQAVKKAKDRKQNWIVKSKDDPKNLVTIFGEVSYKRTYYENKKTGEYCYLSDEMVGIEAHDRLDLSLKARLIEEAIDLSYKKSGEKVAQKTVLSSQTVMNTIRKLGCVDNNAVNPKETKRKVKILYIEADEDHVALQKGGIIEPKLIYVHEGRKRVGKNRWQLINPFYFSGIYADSDELWLEVADYIYKTYDQDAIEKIYLAGDGAKWIKNGLGWIKGSISVLDSYHLLKYVTTATAHIKDLTPLMWKYINQGEKKKLKDLFSKIIIETETETKKKAVIEARKYILNNWEGIKNQQQKDYFGCSVEGHISHILSSRLSSRPLGWSEKGVDQMARLRAFRANGGIVYDLLLEKKQKEQKEAKALKLDQEIREKKKASGSNETIDNLTLINKGKKTTAFQFLRSIRGY